MKAATCAISLGGRIGFKVPNVRIFIVPPPSGIGNFLSSRPSSALCKHRKAEKSEHGDSESQKTAMLSGSLTISDFPS